MLPTQNHALLTVFLPKKHRLHSDICFSNDRRRDTSKMPKTRKFR
jgi:hypothetical protein